MEIAFDPAKNAANKAKHGVTLADASSLEWDRMIAKIDERRAYGEARMVGFAPIGNRVYCVVYTDRGEARRIISLRKANAREVEAYDSEI